MFGEKIPDTLEQELANILGWKKGCNFQGIPIDAEQYVAGFHEYHTGLLPELLELLFPYRVINFELSLKLLSNQSFFLTVIAALDKCSTNFPWVDPGLKEELIEWAATFLCQASDCTDQGYYNSDGICTTVRRLGTVLNSETISGMSNLED